MAAMRLFATLNARGVIATTEAERRTHVAANGSDIDALAALRAVQSSDALDAARLHALRTAVCPPTERHARRPATPSSGTASATSAGVTCDATAESCLVACATLLAQCATADPNAACASLARTLVADQ